MKNIFLAPIKGYQYISRMLPASCRYYPTCSEYAKWQLEFNSIHGAIWSSSLRVLRCNQLFDGGIDYPVVSYKPVKYFSLLKPKAFYGKIKVVYWLVPKTIASDDLRNESSACLTPKATAKYFVIKEFHANKTKQPT